MAQLEMKIILVIVRLDQGVALFELLPPRFILESFEAFALLDQVVRVINRVCEHQHQACQEEHKEARMGSHFAR